MYIYRPARIKDYPSMLQVLETANMHHIPSKEVPKLDWKHCFVATNKKGKIVGMSGWEPVNEMICKTTLMAVLPECKGFGVGNTLQTIRMIVAYQHGFEFLITNADRPHAIAWYKKNFGYIEIGKLPKEHEFGLPDVHEWTTLKTNLKEWYEGTPQ